MPIDPNAFARGYQQTAGMVGGLVDSFREGDRRNALSAYAKNPNDPASLNALAGADPALAIQVRQQQQQSQAAKQEKDTAMIAALARDAKDPATFDAAVDQVVAMGYPDAAQFKGKFSPGLRSALMAAGGLRDEAAQQPTTFMRDAEAAGIRPGTPEFAAAFKARQLRYVTDPNGNIRVVDPNAFTGGPSVPNAAPGAGGGPPAVLTDDDWGDEGGQTPQASGGFLDPLAPRP